MDNLPLNSLEVRYSRAFRDPKKARPGQVDLLVRWHTHRWGNGDGTSATNRRQIFMLQNATSCNTS